MCEDMIYILIAFLYHHLNGHLLCEETIVLSEIENF